MPTYLLHGFRWPRPLVRIHIIMQNIDDAAPEWLVAPGTTLALLRNFHENYPECMEHLGRLRFVEQYDPNDSSTVSGISQPFAYVADLVEEVKLGVEIEEVRGRGLNNDQWTAMMDLRDKIAPEEKVGWYIVVCGDEERVAPPSSADGQESGVDSSAAADKPSDLVTQVNRGPSTTNLVPPTAPTPSEKSEPKSSSSLKKLFSLRLGRRKSRNQLKESKSSQSIAEEGAAAPTVERPPLMPTGDISYSHGSSGTPSIGPSATASTPPLPDDIFELPAITPTSSHSTPPPSEFNFLPEAETGTKYSRTSEIPDYRDSMFLDVEPKYANMPPIEASQKAGRRKSDVPSLSSQRLWSDKRNSTRRYSDIPSIPDRSPRRLEMAGSLPRRSESPPTEFSRDRRVMSFPNIRSGAVSPMTFRSISPSGRSGAASPVARSYSPIRSGAVSPIAENEPSFARSQRRNTLQLRQQRRSQMSMLNTTQLAGPAPAAEPGHQRTSSQESGDDDEVMDEVIMMSPAVRAPTKHFLRRSGTAGTLMSGANRSGSVTALDSINESDGRPYFGQEVDPNDLVAVNLENAFDNL